LLQYKNLISRLSLYLVAAILIFLLLMLFLLILMWMYLGISCLVLQILLCQMAAFVFSNFSLVFL